MDTSNKLRQTNKEQNQLLNCLVVQNDEIQTKLDTLIAIETDKVEELKAMNLRQAKQDRFNLPFVVAGTFFGYSAVHIALYGADSYREFLIVSFDYLTGFFL